MPTKFKQRVRVMRISAYSDLICLIAAMFVIVLSAEILIWQGLSVYLIPCAIVMVACVISAYLFHRHMKKLAADKDPYRVSLPEMTKDMIIARMGATEVVTNGYAATQRWDKYSLRIALQFTDRFDREHISQQRKQLNSKYNRSYGVKRAVSMFDALKMIRINLIVCEEENDELVKYLRTAQQTVFRNEIIVPAAVILGEQVLLYPNCVAGLMVNQVNRYAAVAEYLIQNLCEEK